MSNKRRRSQRRMRIPKRFGDTVCALNNKNGEPLVDNDEQLQKDLSNDDCEEIGEIHQEVRVREIGSGLLKDNNDKVENDENFPLHVNVQSMNTEIGVAMNINMKDTNKTCMDNGDENKTEFVIFDEEMILERSKKWESSTCGYFVGYKMTIQELKCALRGLEYARVLVEVNAQKGLEDYIDVLYKCKEDGKHNDDCKEIGEIHQEVRVCEIGSGLLKDNNDKVDNDENCSNLAKENDNQDKCDLISDGENQLNHPINVSPVPLHVNVQTMNTEIGVAMNINMKDTNKTCMDNGDENKTVKSYAEKLINSKENEDNKMSLISTVLNENG
ncbi:hypothetical protein Tco_1265522 [Tanacetum coccineum]